MRRMKRRVKRILALCAIVSGIGTAKYNFPIEYRIDNIAFTSIPQQVVEEIKTNIVADDVPLQDRENTYTDIPVYSGDSCTIINNNIPFFTSEDISVQPFEYYPDLDSLGRCQSVYANICQELMPTQERGKIGHIKPSGWHTVKYNGLVDGNYLYNRCHLIGYQLAGENDNEKNLITGTRWMNTEGMLPYENMIAEYVHTSGNHVLYRVTPMYKGDNLVCHGVLMEAYSVEDNGSGICFCVFAHNIQPGIVIDYKTGESHLE